MSLRIIALTGPKGSGKDTVARLIANQYEDVRTIAFADPIKDVIQDLFDLDKSNVDQYDQFKRTTLRYVLPGYTELGVSARHVVREIGMLMRKYDDKQFTGYVVNQIRYFPSSTWVVTDLRFDNEYMILKQLGAKIVNINRPNYEYDGHITERGFNESLVDFQLMNDGNLEYLKTRVTTVMNNIMEGWE